MSSGEQPPSINEDFVQKLGDWIDGKQTEAVEAVERLNNMQPDLFSPTVEVLEGISAAAKVNERLKLLKELRDEVLPKE